MSDQSISFDRREFLRAAVAVGGAAAVSACLDFENTSNIPTGVDDPESLPKRQHSWNAYSRTDTYGNIVPPRHHVLVFFNTLDEGVPEEADRNAMEDAFQTLERGYEWSTDGLLFTVAYSPEYFDRFESGLPDTVDLPYPESLASFEDPEFDSFDGVIHFASNHASVVLEAEEAVFGGQARANGVPMRDDLNGVIEKVDRRTGFIGEGLPATNDENVDGIPEGAVDENAPLFMGFKSTFKENQATEDAVTIDRGMFAGGTTQHISLLRTHLDQWYEQDSRWQRVAKMFSAEHAEEDLVEGVGENLGQSSMMSELDLPSQTVGDAFEKGVVGHSQKTARARDTEGNPLLLRRDFATTNDGHTGVHFLSLQASITDFVQTREAMNGNDVANTGGVGTKNNNGILQYITTKRRGNYLLPPRNRRSLPTLDA